jgi:pyruvate dehydrogenase E1 component alpha subunit
MMSELFGRADGYCHGKGGSMHIADFSIGMLGANGIVGGGFGIATGAALSASVLDNGRVALCFFGDGAINQGAFYECANMAAIWQLPLILLCENNQFAMSARIELMTRGRLADRGLALGIPSVDVDGMDAEAVHEAVREAADLARRGGGPSLVVATCYRLAGHFSGDSQRYRTREEVAQWAERDPLLRLRERLVRRGVLTEEAAEELRLEAEQRVDRAVELATSQLWPDPAASLEDVHA